MSTILQFQAWQRSPLSFPFIDHINLLTTPIFVCMYFIFYVEFENLVWLFGLNLAVISIL